MRNPWVRAVVGFVVGLLLFLGIAYSLKAVLKPEWAASPVISQIVLKTTMIVVALVVWLALGRQLSEMGWRKAPWWNRSYAPWISVAALAMMSATVVMIFLGVKHPLAAKMNFLELVLCIWMLSSISEEIYVRGLVQSWIAEGDEAAARSPFAPSIVASTLVFAGMHVPLIWSPMGIQGGGTLVAGTFFAGWGCAVLRARTRSLWPAILCHILANVASIPGGILGTVFFKLLYHRLPDVLTSG